MRGSGRKVRMRGGRGGGRGNGRGDNAGDKGGTPIGAVGGGEDRVYLTDSFVDLQG